MTKLISLEYDKNSVEICSETIIQAIRNKNWVELFFSKENRDIIPYSDLPKQPGIIIKSGGSSGKSYRCFHTYENLNKSAFSTKKWLIRQGIDPKNVSLLNALPIHHISGLMPWWRSRCWGAKHNWIMPSLMKDPIELEENFQQFFKRENKLFLISLVPTQLHRLISNPSGIKWLQSFDLIWIGGSFLSKEIAEKARAERIRLAPCYGSTETAAMITALSPEEFLSGRNDCGQVLQDVTLKVNRRGILHVKTNRLAIGKWNNGRLEKIKDPQGWWQSGDIAALKEKGESKKLEILGRVDSAINSGGETIFPEILESRLLSIAKSANISLEKVLLLPVKDKEWGCRIIALFRLNKKSKDLISSEVIEQLKDLVKYWIPAERPILWHECPELEQNSLGKWDRKHWSLWLAKYTKNKIKKDSLKD